MSENNNLTVSGFTFANEKDAELAREEEKKIYFIRTKLNMNNPESVLVIYNKMIKNRVLRTPMGMSFLQELHDYLMEQPGIDDEEVSSIPLYISYNSEAVEDAPMRSRRIRANSVRTYKREYDICRLIIALLICCIIAMFCITMKADNPNILNYETAIQNKYAQWAQELNEKEAQLKERERALENAGY